MGKQPSLGKRWWLCWWALLGTGSPTSSCEVSGGVWTQSGLMQFSTIPFSANYTLPQFCRWIQNSFRLSWVNSQFWGPHHDILTFAHFGKTFWSIYLSSAWVDVAASFVDIIPKAKNVVIIPPIPSSHISILQTSTMLWQMNQTNILHQPDTRKLNSSSEIILLKQLFFVFVKHCFYRAGELPHSASGPFDDNYCQKWILYGESA